MSRDRFIHYALIRGRGGYYSASPYCGMARATCTEEVGEVTCPNCLDVLSGADAVAESAAEAAYMAREQEALGWETYEQ